MKNTLADKTMTNNSHPQRHFWNMPFKTSPGTVQAMKTAADVTQGKNSSLPRLGKMICYLTEQKEAESTSLL